MAQPSNATTTNAPETANAAAVRSHVGRGGAGNVGTANTSSSDSASLVTPTIKSATYTTGRGGTGNMAQNDPNDPSISRAYQDVDTPKAHDREVKGTYHWGRGGEGNMMTVNGAKVGEGSQLNPAQRQTARRTGSFNAVVEKGKELLGLGGKKEQEKQAAAPENAVQ